MPIRKHLLYVELLPSVVLEVTYTEPGLKGDTASSTALKPAEVETGAKVMVPLFIEMGEKSASTQQKVLTLKE